MIYEISKESDTSSQCSQCKRTLDEQGHQNHAHQQSSEEEGNQYSTQHIPGRQMLRHQPHNHQHLVLLLQEEIRQLKIKNQEQDTQIHHLKSSRTGHLRANFEFQLQKNAKEVQKLKRQVLHSPRRQIVRGLSPELKHYINLPQPSSMRHVQPQLQVVLLQKQIRQLQMHILQLNNKLQSYDAQIDWMRTFIQSFVRMAEELSISYGEKVLIKSNHLRKKTKACWRYIKNFINCLIK